MSRYLSWCGYKTRVFNVGNRRRLFQTFSPTQDRSQSSPSSPPKATEGWFLESSPNGSSEKTGGCVHHAAAFFDPSNSDASALRDQVALDTLDEVFAWLDRGGKVAIHDATNSTQQRRKILLETVAAHHTNIQAFFVESICTDQQVLDQNMQMKLQGPDYAHMDPEKALEDFKERVANYEKSYATISEEEEELGLSYIKIINVGKKVIANAIHGYLPSQCVLYLMQIHIKPRTIWLTRHGESEYNVQNRIGGDPSLTLNGRGYAKALTRFISSQFGGRSSVVSSSSSVTEFLDGAAASATGLEILTSTLRRTIETVEGLDRQGFSVQHMR